ncbi:DUF3103 family protein [Streptomyces sp. MUM 178J]|uniref:DUF3103 family protein n=1 Tax=Streptomyces sp. MUM 178J TaxID=2791991 RepID=UPI001F037B5D|nr:DUF3103 family protein [Streptomyces sp. MUM 178J]WRQ77967.1 DUF3103 family protein [Streptomyces sp. MUM 178J]
MNSAPAAAAPISGADASDVAQAKEQAARGLAGSLSDAAWRDHVRRAVLSSGEVAVTTLAEGADRQLQAKLTEADRRVAASKGLPAGVGSLLRLRLGTDSMRAALAAGATPWVAAAGSDDGARTATAYDSRGRAHALDTRTPPRHPVYVVDIDGAKALAAGIEVLKEQLGRYGLASSVKAGPAPSVVPDAPAASSSATGSGFWTTRITSVRLSDDEEPWIKGNAEIYTLVTGFGHDGKVRVDPVDMPYLDDDGVTYHPNQVLVNWSLYKYNLADAVMMEDDDGTNYRNLAKAIAAVLLTVVDQGAYIPLVSAVLDAMPDSWWTDDDDYVDSWYTLARSDSGVRKGARGNGTMTVQPYFVEQF